MTGEPLFKGLVIDEFDQPVGTAKIGDEPCYVVDDGGFLRHILSKPIDLEILRTLGGQIAGNEDMIAEQAGKMMGQEDPFTRAILENQLKNIEKQYEMILEVGIPESTLAYLGMVGFRVVIDVHGEILRIDQPSAPPSDGGEGE